MRVYIKQYKNFPRIIGVYTYQGMIQDKKQYINLGRKRLQELKESAEKTLANYITARTNCVQSIRLLDAIDEKKYKNTEEAELDKKMKRKRRRKLQKERDNYFFGIDTISKRIKEYEDKIKDDFACIEYYLDVTCICYVEQEVNFSKPEN